MTRRRDPPIAAARWRSAAWHAAGWAVFGVGYVGAVVFVADGLDRSAGDVLLVLAAVARAGATDVVDRLPGGLDAQLGANWPGGVDLSIGQWQKVALARGFLRRDPALIVLDGAHVAEIGTHDELMSRAGSYAELYTIQARAYR